jgi:nucleoside-diphosphate-sugar epimerase
LWVRATTNEQLQAKKEKIIKATPQLDLTKVIFCGGDLSADSPYSSVPLEKVEYILHTAAVIRFNVENDLANNVNIEGTRKTLEMSKRCKNLKHFFYLGTVYATGAISGLVEEKVYRDVEFINHYERSKNASEKMIFDDFPEVPASILRIATVISDDIEGNVIQYNVFHNTLRLLYNGLISLLPGNPETPLYLVTGTFVREALLCCMEMAEVKKVYNICHTENESATLNDLVEIVFKTFHEYESFKQRRIMAPMFADQEAFDTLAETMQKFSQGVLGDALSSITPFAKQLYIKKDFKNDNLKKIMKNYKAPDQKQLIANVTRYLVRTSWGRK